MQLKGENIYLGAFKVYNFTPLQEWLEDEEVVRYGGVVKTISQYRGEVERYINKLLDNPNCRLFGIYLDNNNYIGNIRLDIEWVWRVGTISILIGDKDQWGKGYGTEAINLITDFGFNTLGLHKIEAGILENNNGSIKAFQKAGFEIEGRKKHNRFNMGKYVDVIMMGKVNASCQESNCNHITQGWPNSPE